MDRDFCFRRLDKAMRIAENLDLGTLKGYQLREFVNYGLFTKETLVRKPFRA